MYERIEQRARERGDALLWVHASLIARPAFVAVGFAVRHSEAVEIGGETLQRFELEKRLTG
jgi:putative acetyltransferase